MLKDSILGVYKIQRVKNDGSILKSFYNPVSFLCTSHQILKQQHSRGRCLSISCKAWRGKVTMDSQG